MSSTSAPVHQIHALTSLRFFAAIWVVMHHFGAPFVANGSVFLKRLFESGAVGVSFFFVLSGFILAINYPLERLRTGPFLLARFARIYPIYALGALASSPFFLSAVINTGWFSAISQILQQGVLCILLIQAWFPEHATALNPPSWSLSAEAFFYVMFLPVLSWAPSRRFLDRTRISVFVLWLLAMVAPLWWIFAHPGLVPSLKLTGMDAWSINLVSFHPLIRIPEFLLGVALGRAHIAGARLSRPGTTAFLCLVVVLVLATAFPPAWGPIVISGLPALPFGLFVLGLTQARGKIADLASHPLLVFLGESSYSLYILHVPVFLWMRMASTRLGLDNSSVSWCLAYLLATLSISCAAYLWIETPARRRIRSLADRFRG